MKTKTIILSLSLLIAILALFAAGSGVLIQGSGPQSTFTTLRGETVTIQGHGLYRLDTINYASQAIGQDWVTLVMGVPLLFVGMFLTWKDSLRGRLVLTGALAYFLYTYTSMAFLLEYNEFFLIYVVLFSASLFAFILAISSLHPEELIRRISARYPRKSAIVYLLFIALFLTVAWVGKIVTGLATHTPPVGLEAYSTLVIQAMDLGIIVPASMVTAILLWQKRPWGYTLVSVLLIKGVLMGVALVAMIIGMVMAHVPVDPIQSACFCLIPIIGSWLTIRMLQSVA
jgi:hypothetical protein